MKKKKIDNYLTKVLHRYSREKKRCRAAYPDWQDDAFNMLDNKFIWGYNENPKITPSFLSWDDAYIYYNRINKTFYMEVDTGFYMGVKDAEDAQGELERLSKIEEAFRNFLTKNGIPLRAEVQSFHNFTLEGESLSELYTKFKIQLEGYKFYRNEKPQS